jgi:hypothetical protein
LDSVRGEKGEAEGARGQWVTIDLQSGPFRNEFGPLLEAVTSGRAARTSCCRSQVEA